MEKLIDVIGFEGYYKISEDGSIYKIRPNLECGFDIIKKININSQNKGTKREQKVVSLSRNGIRYSVHHSSIFHDSFYPQRKGLAFSFKDKIVCLENLLLKETRRTGNHSSSAKKDVIRVLKQNPKLHNSEIGRICGVCTERVRQIKKENEKETK